MLGKRRIGAARAVRVDQIGNVARGKAVHIGGQAQVVARRDAKVFNGIGRGAVLPHRSDLLSLGGGAMVQNIAAHGYKLLISFAH